MSNDSNVKHAFAYKDLREWIREADKLGEMKYINGLSWEREIGMVTEMLHHTDPAPCGLFDEVPGVKKGFRVLTNFFSAKRANMTLGFPTHMSKLELSQAFLDVYLKDLGGQGIYGYCVPEKRVKNRTASGYCVLDNDFSQAQFPNAAPIDNLLVTAGHEFFHAIQFGYDYAEDRWMMESTATWMEERIATQVNDNRQYFQTSPIYAPYVPLDLFSQQYTFQYGSWVWWEYLSTKYGLGIVKKAWDQAGSLKKDGGKNSIPALQKVLKKKGGLTKNFATFAAGNLTPAANYPEGAEYPFPKFANGKVLGKGKSKRFKARLFHLAASSYGYVPKNLDGKKWKLAVSVNGPVKRTSPAAVVVVHLKNGKRQVKLVKLNRNGDGHLKVTFNSKRVAIVSVTLVNASTRYKCNKGTTLACRGKSLDDKLRFTVTGRVTKR